MAKWDDGRIGYSRYEGWYTPLHSGLIPREELAQVGSTCLLQMLLRLVLAASC